MKAHYDASIIPIFFKNVKFVASININPLQWRGNDF